jgi:hypothetical protein
MIACAIVPNIWPASASPVVYQSGDHRLRRPAVGFYQPLSLVVVAAARRRDGGAVLVVINTAAG